MDAVTVSGCSHPHHPEHFLWLRRQSELLSELIAFEIKKAVDLFECEKKD